MQKPETDTDIDLILSLAHATHDAHWDSKAGRHSITLNLPRSWNDAVQSIETAKGKPFDGDAGSPWNVDTYIDALIDNLETTFLIERVCIERRRQGLRMKRDRCKPCCLNRVVAFMVNHCHLCIWYPEVQSRRSSGDSS